MNKKVKAATLSVVSNSCLTIMKLVVGIMMGSISVISEAIHSGIDLVASLIDYFSVRQSSKPADWEHPYGHGKFENVGSILEAILIIVAAVVIIYKAVPRFFNTTEVESLGIGVVVMGISVVVNLIVSTKLMKVAKETDSPALEGDAQHLRADVLTSLGIFIGLGAIKVTGLMILDPIIAIFVSLVILKTGYDLIKKSMKAIVDEALSDEEISEIEGILKEHSFRFLEYHKLRTRKAGSQRFVDLHLVMPPERSIEEVHNINRHLEKRIKETLPQCELIIKVEPCRGECRECEAACRRIDDR